MRGTATMKTARKGGEERGGRERGRRRQDGEGGEGGEWAKREERYIATRDILSWIRRLVFIN